MNVAFDHDHSPSEGKTDTIPGVAKRFKSRGQPWALVVDDNYGEGSAREHAALQPRFYGESCNASLPRTSGTPANILIVFDRWRNDHRSIVCPHPRN